MRAKMINEKIPSWSEIVTMVPLSILQYMETLRKVKENPLYHPNENNAYEHVKNVYERALKIGDIDLVMAALCHDLGKAIVYEYKDGKDYAVSHGHEMQSVLIMEKTSELKHLIEDLGANYETVLWIVDNHMRMGRFEDMRLSKQQKLMSHPMFFKLKQFTEECDHAK